MTRNQVEGLMMETNDDLLKEVRMIAESLKLVAMVAVKRAVNEARQQNDKHLLYGADDFHYMQLEFWQFCSTFRTTDHNASKEPTDGE